MSTEIVGNLAEAKDGAPAQAKPRPGEPEITLELAKEHGLTQMEYTMMLSIMGRQPTLTELGIFSAMWSEHCSYKSSRAFLARLPTEAPWVIQGPGENAGVIDVGDNQAIVFKMESHNHPSFIEPYQGAATGVGGIMRDVFTMGARPIANLNALRFGDPDHPKTRHLVSGVVAGIGGYGNCVGIPTVAGETNFHSAYNGNILVNAMTVGLAPADRIFYSKASGVGNPVVYVGSKTGRDGIHGATMSSAEFDDESEAKRPTVQVGDPFTEKLVMEACLELMATDTIIAIQDMGAAGLTSSSVEMADKGDLGMLLHLDKVPLREEAMVPYEIMLSESQERMLIVLKPGAEEQAKAIFDKWELDFAVVGELTDTGRLELFMHGDCYADIPVKPLVEKSPKYERPHTPTPPQPALAADLTKDAPSVPDSIQQLVASPDLASRRWIWEQYDSFIGGDTLQGPGGDAAVVRLPDTEKAIAVTTDCTPRYCLADPVEGGKQAVAEAYRNLSAVGAKPLAITDNMNFGNPEKPEIMGQFVGCVDGMAEACKILEFPVVSGNVSLYNETNGIGIMPTPAIGGVGVLPSVKKTVGLAPIAGDELYLLGDTQGHLGQSVYLREIAGHEAGPPPPVDLATERKHGEIVRKLIADSVVDAAHDLSDGGLGIALIEMLMAGEIGCQVDTALTGKDVGFWFGEDQGRYLLATRDPAALRKIVGDAPLTPVGKIGGDSFVFGETEIAISSLVERHQGWMPNWMSHK
ncbi:MAG: phosphoribosylformylglycinamidine synthase subunit PurL [Alphaproteobacteria bacterium]|nr:phosphoribosylformylglycinamidine synthase subunit PurL [Alphaproteobacteria bacterium SS10]